MNIICNILCIEKHSGKKKKSCSSRTEYAHRLLFSHDIPLNFFSADDRKKFLEISHGITNWKDLAAEIV